MKKLDEFFKFIEELVGNGGFFVKAVPFNYL
jgi:hypothetical protein